ncbi:MAG TPA: SRPBCC domain-containing protein [Solirubrobacteraceae bacterium]|jgi:carbon monoxide dehydrogenase subunit G|nr:SRPBCC domain-containing protein [Solirubrobacteraceae bacterium]
MQFDNSFSVQAPIAAVFAAVGDVDRVVPCVPGAKVLERRGGDVYEVALKAQLGVVWRTYFGTLTVLERDVAGHRVVMRNRARDARGKPVGEARIEIGLAELGSHTNVSIYSRVRIVDGMLAEKTITQASAKQMKEFTEALRSMVSADPVG